MELARDLLVRESPCDRHQYIDFTVRKTCRPPVTRPSLLLGLASGQEHRLNSSGIQAPSRDLPLQLARDLVRFERRSPSAILAHRLVDLRHREQTGSEWQCVCRQPNVVAGAVKSIVMEARDRSGSARRGCE